jgi:hypothetical protein
MFQDVLMEMRMRFPSPIGAIPVPARAGCVVTESTYPGIDGSNA